VPLETEGCDQAMNRNILYLVIGALVVVIVVIGYWFYQERQKTTGIEINVGKSGISIEKK
jgi:RsiW-degrading membrane proteinase PrsW (M82 family)